MTIPCCDLHMHSTHSDGTMTPRELVLQAKETGLSAVALTDHDTTSGMAEMQQAGRELDVRVLSGVEISVEYAGKTVHMLGYCFDAAGESLQVALDELVRGRTERNHEIIRKLQSLGIDISYAEVVAESGGKVVGRPHFAAVMLRKGAVENRQQAFDEYLASGAKAYVDRLKFSPEDSVRMIREAGGVAVLAHPKFVRLQPDEKIDEVVERLVEAGLGGIECWYSMHSPEETNHYLEIARRFNLVVTGGSDFHGGAKPDIAMGTGLGDLCVPLSCADALEASAKSGGLRP